MQDTSPSELPPPPGGLAGRLSRLSFVGVTVVGTGALFLFTGGWLSPRALTPARVVDELESVNGRHAGFRRNHAKGVGVSGYFESNGQGVRLSRATVFRPGRVSRDRSLRARRRVAPGR